MSASNPFHAIATRGEAAYQSLLDALCELGEISRDDAKKVAALYQAQKIVKFDHVGGRFHVKHGAFLDRATIQYAAERANA